MILDPVVGGAEGWFPGGSDGKEGNGNPLQYSCLENSMDREPSRLHTVHGFAKESGLTEWPTLVEWVRGETVGPRG